MEWITGVTVKIASSLCDRFGGGDSLCRIIGLAAAAGLRTVVIEEAPTEEEFASEYAVFYKDLFAKPSKRTPTRLHLFSEDLAGEKDLSVTQKVESYLGYCDIRPTRGMQISGALLDVRAFVRSSTEFVFPVCKRKFSVTLAGATLSVDAFPYVQQDGLSIRCAHAALASISWFYDKSKAGPEFTKIGAGAESLKRALPSGGLSPYQIALGLRSIDREPVVFEYDPKKPNQTELSPPERTIYRYLESGIPVLVGIEAGGEDHILVVVGHTFSPDSWPAETLTAYYGEPKSGRTRGWEYRGSTDWVERYIVQDDNLGPYTLVPAWYLKQICRLVMVPLEPCVFFMGEEAEAFVAFLFTSPSRMLVPQIDGLVADARNGLSPWSTDIDYWFDKFREQLDKDNLVLRTNLRSSTQWLQEQKQSAAYPFFKHRLDALRLPEKIWVVELSWPAIFRHGRYLCGEVVLDPSDAQGNRQSPLDRAWLWLHIPGVVGFRDPSQGSAQLETLAGDDPIRNHFRTKHLS